MNTLLRNAIAGCKLGNGLAFKALPLTEIVVKAVHNGMDRASGQFEPASSLLFVYVHKDVRDILSGVKK